MSPVLPQSHAADSSETSLAIASDRGRLSVSARKSEHINEYFNQLKTHYALLLRSVS